MKENKRHKAPNMSEVIHGTKEQTQSELVPGGLKGTCGQSGYVFQDICLKQGIDFLNRVSFLGKFLK